MDVLVICRDALCSKEINIEKLDLTLFCKCSCLDMQNKLAKM